MLQVDLARTGVRVTLISPGPDSKPGVTKRKAMLRAEDVAAAVLYAVTQPLRLDVTEIRLMPTIYTPRG